MVWTDRLRPTVKLVSPKGKSFEAYWRGDPRRIEKKLGIFNLPQIDGANVQDLGSGPRLYTLTVFFEGPDNDLEADAFFKSCRDRGTWSITHPVTGLLKLYLVTAIEAMQPVRSGNITQVGTEWIEPRTEEAGESLLQQATGIKLQTESVNEIAGEQFDDLYNSNPEPASGLNLVKTLDNYLTIYNETLLALTNQVQAVKARAAGVYRGIKDSLAKSVLNTIGLAAQIQELVQLPILASDDLKARLELYDELIIRSLDSVDIPEPDYPGRDAMASHELFLTASLTALAQIAITGLFTTRPDAVAGAQKISELFVQVTNRLDEIQAFYTPVNAMRRYYSQMDSFVSVWALNARSVRYILETSFDLAAERRFILKRNRAPIELVIDEFGTLGDGDINFDRFIEENNLTDTEIFLLPVGREVVLYV